MEATNPKLVACVRAKDETAELKLDVNLNTTLGELLRYWTWRETSDKPADGFLIDLSLTLNRAAANQVNAPAAVEFEAIPEADIVPSSPPFKKQRITKKAAAPSQAVSLITRTRGASPATPKRRETPAQENQFAMFSELAAASAVVQASAAPLPSPSLKRSKNVSRPCEIQPGMIPDIIEVEGYESETVDPGGEGFHVGFHSYETDCKVYFYVQPWALARALCREASVAVGVEFSALRFTFTTDGDRLVLEESQYDRRTDLLIRDRAAIGQTVESWGAKEGDMIEIIPCQCGC